MCFCRLVLFPSACFFRTVWKMVLVSVKYPHVIIMLVIKTLDQYSPISKNVSH